MSPKSHARNVSCSKGSLSIVVLLFSVNSEILAAANGRESLVSQRIYQVITDDFACFRMMNATHQTGCTSKEGGSVGVIQLVQSQSDIDWVIEKGPFAPYVALIYLESFTSEVLERFHASGGRVSGVILLKRNQSIEGSSYSPDYECPNRGYGFYKGSTELNFCPKWNQPGSGILYRDWSFPIFYVASVNSTNYLLDCFKSYNEPKADGTPRDWPLCSAELESYMTAAVDTPTCVRRNKLNEVSISPSIVCDPLGDANVWSTLSPSNQTKPYKNGSVIVIAARLDASSMFDQISPGADTAATGIAGILALVKQLAPLKSLLQSGGSNLNVSNIYFILFNGEAFDYIGSSRVVYDMVNDKFPYEVEPGKAEAFPTLLHMDDIMYYIELNQLALYSPLDLYYTHMNWNSTEFRYKGFNKLFEILQRQSTNVRIDKPETTDMGVPPSSLQSFLARNSEFPGVVITNHAHGFKNRFYNSIFDDAENIGYQNVTSRTVIGIASIVATIGRAVEELITGEQRPFSSIKPNPDLVNEILQCYVKSPNCKLFGNITTDDITDALSKVPYAYYVGVNRRINVLTTITQYAMGYYQGEIVNRTKEDCHRSESDSKVFEYMWMSESCYETTAVATPAVSPAFDDVDTYDWESGLYSTWTESIWSNMRVRVFLQASKTHEIITLVSGIVVFAASIVLFSWINANAESIFKSRSSEGVC